MYQRDPPKLVYDEKQANYRKITAGEKERRAEEFKDRHRPSQYWPSRRKTLRIQKFAKRRHPAGMDSGDGV